MNEYVEDGASDDDFYGHCEDEDEDEDEDGDEDED